MGNIRVTNECNWVGFHLANSTTQEASLAGKFTGGVVETLIMSVRASYCAEECKEVEKEEFREFEAKRSLGLEEKQLRRK